MRIYNRFDFILNRLLSLFIFIFIFNCNELYFYIQLPLEYIPSKNYNFPNGNKSPEDIIQQIFYKNIITRIEIGSPSQKIPIFLKIDTDKFFFTSVNPLNSSNYTKINSNFYNFTDKELYNESISFTYKEEECKKVKHFIYFYDEICNSKEIIIFNSSRHILNKEFPIKIVRNYDYNIPGYIGLLFNDSNFEEKKSFITLLAREKIIDNYFYFFDLEESNLLQNKIKGNLIIGGLPHEIFPEKYSIDNFILTNCYISSVAPDKWRFGFEKIYLNNGIESNKFTNKLISLNFEIYHIIGTNELRFEIKKNFLDKLTEDKKCFYSNFSQNICDKNNISFYYCHKSAQKILFDNLKSINFYSSQFDYTFSLTNEELFYFKDDYIYLNILFNNYEQNYWTLGQIFTTKYQFIFNTNIKQIGFYTKVKVENPENKRAGNNNFLFILVLGICIFIFTFLGIFVGRNLFSWRRKIIANELIEELNYEYKIENNKIKPNIIESKYKSKVTKKNNLLFEMKNKFNE